MSLVEFHCMENNLKHYRHKMEMNKSEFAAFLGVSLSQYSRWENQKIQPSVDTLIMIRDKLRAHFPNLTLDNLVK